MQTLNKYNRIDTKAYSSMDEALSNAAKEYNSSAKPVVVNLGPQNGIKSYLLASLSQNDITISNFDYIQSGLVVSNPLAFKLFTIQ